MRVSPLTALVIATALAAACDSKTPAAPSSSSTSSSSTAAGDSVLIVRALDADTKAAISGLDVTILDGPRAGNSSSSPSDQLPVSLPAGRVTLRVSAAGHEPKELAVEVSGAALLEVAVQRSAAPPPSPSPTVAIVSGVVRDSATGRGIAGAVIEAVGANVSVATTTDGNGAYRLQYAPNDNTYYEIKASAASYTARTINGVMGSRALDIDLVAIPFFQFSGFVRDGQGRPVVGALVDGGGSVGVTDASGRYEFRSVYSSVSAHVRPPDGYEPKPRGYGGFELVPGQDITIRRIVRVSIAPPATMTPSTDQVYTRVEVTVEFDTGVDRPLWDDFSISSSDTTVVRGRVQYQSGYLEGVKPGTAEVWGSYYGAQSARHIVQVVPR